MLFQCTFRCICLFDFLFFNVAFYSLHPSMFSFEQWQPIRNLLPSIVSIGNSLNGVFSMGAEIPSFQTFPSWIFEAHKKNQRRQINPKVMVYCLVGDLGMDFFKWFIGQIWCNSFLKKTPSLDTIHVRHKRKGPLVVRINWGIKMPPLVFEVYRSNEKG